MLARHVKCAMISLNILQEPSVPLAEEMMQAA